MAGPGMWAADTYQPFPVAAAANWWDASLNRVAAAYTDPATGEYAAAWAHAGVVVKWDMHAVERMYERNIRVDQVVAAFIRNRRTEHRPREWPSDTWVHAGLNGVKVYVMFEGEALIDPGKFVYKIVTVVDEGENLNT